MNKSFDFSSCSVYSACSGNDDQPLPTPTFLHSHLILLGKPQVVIRNRSWEDPQRSPRRRVNVESEAQRGRNKEGGRDGPQQPALSLRETQPRLFSNRGLFWLQETLSAVPDHWGPRAPRAAGAPSAWLSEPLLLRSRCLPISAAHLMSFSQRLGL